jgi:hypothetical protein
MTIDDLTAIEQAMVLLLWIGGLCMLCMIGCVLEWIWDSVISRRRWR